MRSKMFRKRSKSVGDHRQLSVRSTSINSIATEAAEKQGRLMRLFKSMQRKKERSDRRSLHGMFGLSIISLVFGLAAVCVECTTKLKYPRASAAMLSMESAGIFVGSFAMFAGLLGIFTWKISASGHKSCLVGCVQTLAKFNAICSLGVFALCLIAFGVYRAFRDWQQKLSPYIKMEQNFASKLGREELKWPEHVLEELVILKAVALSFHVIICITSVINSVFCLFNLYVNSLPDFKAAQEVLTTTGKMLTWPRSMGHV